MFEDKNASIVLNDSYQRIVYQEKKDVDVILDITNQEMSLRRQGDWLTHGLFSPSGESFLIIKSELGTMKFDVLIESFELKENSLYIKYHLLEFAKKTSTHVYTCTWNRRDDLWQQDH